VHAVGSAVRLELMRQDGGGCIEAIAPGRYNELKFQKEARFRQTPKSKSIFKE
jgi:hypothetical protein